MQADHNPNSAETTPRNFWEEFVSHMKNEERGESSFEPWESPDTPERPDWALDTLRAIANHMGGETFAIRKGRSYSPVEPRRPLSEKDLIAHAKKIRSIGCYFHKPGTDVVSAAVLDLDNHGGLSKWDDMVDAAKKVIESLRADQVEPSLLVRSRSGNGIHIYLLFTQPRSAKTVRAYLTHILADCGYSPGNGGVAANQVELFPKQDAVPADGLGNLVGLPFSGKGAALDPQTFDVVDEIAITICDRAFPEGKKEKAKKDNPQPDDDDDDKPSGFEAILAEIGDGTGLEGFNEPLYRAAASYVAKFYELLDVEKLKALMRKAIDEAPKGPGRTTAEIENYKSDKKLDSYIKPAIRKFIEERGVTKEHFYFHPSGKYIFTPSSELWPGPSVDKRINPIPLVKSDGSPLMTGKGKTKKVKTMLASDWVSKYRSVEQMTWAPGYPQLIKDLLVADGGFVEHPGAVIFNLYRPPPEIMTENTPDVSMWTDHIYKVYPDEAQHIIKYLAYKVQFPGEKINHALVLGGEQGIGKDTLFEPAKRAVGPWNCQEVSPQKILGTFSGHLKAVLLRVSEARDLGGDTRFNFYDKMKTILTVPPDTIQINEKHLPEYYIANVCGVIITTNNKHDGLHLNPDDRRHFVAWSSLTKEDFTAGYWTQLWNWYEHGGCKAVASYLMKLDLSDFDPKAPPPQTETFHAIVATSTSPETREMMALFDAMGNPKAVITEDLADAARDVDMDGLAEWLEDRRNSRQINHRLFQAEYEMIPNPDTKKKDWKVNKRDVYIYGPKGTPAERVQWARDFKKKKEEDARQQAETPNSAAEKSAYFSGASKRSWQTGKKPRNPKM